MVNGNLNSCGRIDELADDYAGKIKVGKLDTDANKEMSRWNHRLGRRHRKYGKRGQRDLETGVRPGSPDPGWMPPP